MAHSAKALGELPVPPGAIVLPILGGHLLQPRLERGGVPSSRFGHVEQVDLAEKFRLPFSGVQE